MSGDEIPRDIRRFIAEHVRSVVELELLLLMHANPNRAWTAGELAGELRVATSWAERELEDLSRRGLVTTPSETPGRFQYAPTAADLAGTISELAKVYAERRVTITQMIFTAPTDPIQSFSDAFRFRKEDSDG